MYIVLYCIIQLFCNLLIFENIIWINYNFLKKSRKQRNIKCYKHVAYYNINISKRIKILSNNTFLCGFLIAH